MKKTAVLLDLGFLLHALYRPLGNRLASADQIHDFANRCLKSDEELFRIYCYHCPPFTGTELHPITGHPVHFKNSTTHAAMTKFLSELCLKDNVAFRAGEISFHGWVVKKHVARELARTRRPLNTDDLKPDLKQKRVDMKIGLDVAWLASRGIVDRIVLVTGDSDFIPAMKFARREGVQIILVTLNQCTKRELSVHADTLRTVAFGTP